MRRYRQWAVNKVLPIIGSTPVGKVTAEQAQHLVGTLVEKGLAPNSIQSVVAAIHDAFAQALKWRIVKFNPFTGLQLPKVEKTRPLCVDPAQALAFVEVIRPHRLFPALMMMLSLGLRRGEVCGLRRNTDVDLGRGMVRVDGTLQYLKREIHWGSPKSTESRRTLRLPSFLQAILIAHYAA